jgi:hypothetical protein
MHLDIIYTLIHDYGIKDLEFKDGNALIASHNQLFYACYDDKIESPIITFVREFLDTDEIIDSDWDISRCTVDNIKDSEMIRDFLTKYSRIIEMK